MHVEKVRAITDEVYKSVLRLIPELGSHKELLSRDELVVLVASDSAALFVARSPEHHDRIVGTLTIIIYRVPTGIRSIIEDVAVDRDFRRRGIARTLMTKALEFARDSGASAVTLTSNPQREAANLLYQSMGFERRTTNSYIYRIK